MADATERGTGLAPGQFVYGVLDGISRVRSKGKSEGVVYDDLVVRLDRFDRESSRLPEVYVPAELEGVAEASLNGKVGQMVVLSVTSGYYHPMFVAYVGAQLGVLQEA